MNALYEDHVRPSVRNLNPFSVFLKLSVKALKPLAPELNPHPTPPVHFNGRSAI